MGIRPRTRRAIKLKGRRCAKCHRHLHRQDKRCKTCHRLT